MKNEKKYDSIKCLAPVRITDKALLVPVFVDDHLTLDFWVPKSVVDFDASKKYTSEAQASSLMMDDACQFFLIEEWFAKKMFEKML